jgi:hypothetical protein
MECDALRSIRAEMSQRGLRTATAVVGDGPLKKAGTLNQRQVSLESVA